MSIKTDPTRVVMYASKYCIFCMRAKQLLNAKTDKLSIINTDGNAKLRAELKSKTGSRTVPQIWVGNTYVGGCDDLYQLERSGELTPLLEQL